MKGEPILEAEFWHTVWVPKGLQVAACHALNRHHYGEDQVPLDAEVPPALRDATHRAFAGCMMPHTLRLYADGSFTITPKSA